MKVLTWIALIWTILGGLSVLSNLLGGYDIETNIFSMAYMALLVYVLWPVTQK